MWVKFDAAVGQPILKGKPFLISRLRHNNEHQVLFVLRKGESQGYYYDGLSLPEIGDSAQAVMHLFQDCFELDSAEAFAVKVPKQYDQWSCGHRIILIFRHLLANRVAALSSEGAYEVDLAATNIPSSVVSNAALFQLCSQTGSVKMETPTIKRERVEPPRLPESEEHARPKSEATNSSSAQPTPAQPCRAIPEFHVHKVKAELKRQAEMREEVAASTMKRPKLSTPAGRRQSQKEPAAKPHASYSAGQTNTPEHPESLPATPKARERSNLFSDVRGTPEAVPLAPKRQQPEAEAPVAQLAQEIDESIEEIMKSREEKKRARRCDEAAKRILRQAGLDHNSVFQKAHSGASTKGHWSSFKQAIMGNGNIECSVCQNLMMQYSIEVTKMESESFKAASQIEGTAPTAESELALVPFVGPCNKRARAG